MARAALEYAIGYFEEWRDRGKSGTGTRAAEFLRIAARR
jgi:hypothetical protein